MKININDTVKVILTEAGARHYNEVWNEYTLYGIEPKNLVAGDILKTQLWCLMQDFGSEIGMCQPLMFETEIEVVE